MSSDDQTRSPANAGSPARGPGGPPPTGVQAPTAYEAWLFARALAGLAFDHADPRLDAPSRPLAQAMSDRDRGSRHEALDAHLATLADDDAGAWREALLAAAPDDPPPDDGWGMPLAFTLLPVEPFPLDLYPRTVARLVEDGARAIGCPPNFLALTALAVAGAAVGRSASLRRGARAIGCPPDFLALTALAVAGAAVGRSASLRLKDGYFASAGLFAACIGQPGDGKSPAVVVDPIARIEEDQFAAWVLEKAIHDADRVDRERVAGTAGRARPGWGQSKDEGSGDGRPVTGGDAPPPRSPSPTRPPSGGASSATSPARRWTSSWRRTRKASSRSWTRPRPSPPR